MQSQWIPSRIIEYTSGRDLVDADYLLFNCGRALAFIGMAAAEIRRMNKLDRLQNEQRVAEYHAYVGVSAARTAIDALSSWLNVRLGIRLSGAAVDVKKPKFRNLVLTNSPRIKPHVLSLADLATEIDHFRQRAQHREGLGLVNWVPGGWHIGEGIAAPRGLDQDLAELLTDWTGRTSREVFAILDRIP